MRQKKTTLTDIVELFSPLLMVFVPTKKVEYFSRMRAETTIFGPQNSLKLGQNGHKSCSDHPNTPKFGTNVYFGLYLGFLHQCPNLRTLKLFFGVFGTPRFYELES